MRGIAIGLVVCTVVVLVLWKWFSGGKTVPVREIPHPTTETKESAVDPPVVPVQPPPAPVPKKGRVIRLDRTTGSDFLNISGLVAWAEGTAHSPINGGVEPMLDRNRWEHLIDNLPSTAITQAVPNGRIWIDLGSDKPIDRIVLTNWTHPTVALQNMVFRRILGATLSILDSSNTVVWTYTFTQALPLYDLKVE